MSLLIKTFCGGPVETNGFLVADGESREGLIIDAPAQTGLLSCEMAEKHQINVKYLVITHGHWDHIVDNWLVLKRTNAKLLAHPLAKPLLENPNLMRAFGLPEPIPSTKPDKLIDEGDVITIGKVVFQVLHCPGHCPGSICLYAASHDVVFSGDVLFAGSVGRTDLPGGSWEQLEASIRQKLFKLPQKTKVYPGHGPITTIANEKKHNPFLN